MSKGQLEKDKYYTNEDVARILRFTPSTARKLTESLSMHEKGYKGADILKIYSKGIIYLR